jgi:hypothetical protein
MGTFTKKQWLHHEQFGEGQVIAILDDYIKVQFSDAARTIMAECLQPAKTLEELEEKLEAEVAWLPGKEWNLRRGGIIRQIKRRCKHGQYGAILKKHHLARSTADDLVKRWEEENHIPAPRENEPKPEPEPELHVRIPVSSEQQAAYQVAKQNDPERVQRLWHQTLLTIIGASAEPEVLQEEIDELLDGEQTEEDEGGAKC